MSRSKKRGKVRMADVAQLAGCSPAAVSHVLTGAGAGSIKVGSETAARIKSAAEELEFQPSHAAQQLAGKRTNIIGMLATAWRETMQLRAFAWVEECAGPRGYSVLATQTTGHIETFKHAVRTYEARGIENLIYFAYETEAQWPVARQVLAEVPNVVSILGNPGIEHGFCVDVDLAEGARQSVHHLAEKGRRRIALLLHDQESMVSRRRLKGFHQALRELGRPHGVDQVFDTGGTWSYDCPGQQQRIERKVDSMFKAMRPDAIIANDDFGAAQLIRELSRRSIHVPDEVAIVGHENQVISHYTDPPLTTVDIPVRQIVEKALAILIDMAEDPTKEFQSVTLQPELLIREST